MLRVALSLLLVASLGNAEPKFIHQSPAVCDFLLSIRKVQLGDLISMKIVEPNLDNDLLFSPADGIEDHEVRTASLLASRLGRKIALIPKLSRSVAVPAVDGVIFNDDGSPDRNFSLKTFVPLRGSNVDLHAKLRDTLNEARFSIQNNYDAQRWKDIICGRLPKKVSGPDRVLECQVHTRIFGLDEAVPRPVSIVVDYTLDPTAIFRVTVEYSAGFTMPEAFLSLTEKGRGINLVSLMERIARDPKTREYIFLGPHNLLSVTATGYQMTEYCDHLGHGDCHGTVN